MHECSTPHEGKSHRRRNRFLKKTLEPLHWWSHEIRKDGTINSGDKRPSFVKTSGGKQETSDKKQKTGRLVETAPATALSWLKKKVPLFGGGRT